MTSTFGGAPVEERVPVPAAAGEREPQGQVNAAAPRPALMRELVAEMTVVARSLRDARRSFEREYIRAVLEMHRGRMAEAAAALGMRRSNLYRKMRSLSLTRRAVVRQ